MNRSKSLIFAIALFLLAAPAAAAEKQLRNIYHQAKVVKITDGDTFTALVEYWPRHYTLVAIRLRGLDTPEIRGKCDREKDLAQKARAVIEHLLPVDSRVTLLEVDEDKFGGRYDAVVLNKDGLDVGKVLIAADLARPYKGDKRQSWCDPKEGEGAEDAAVES